MTFSDDLVIPKWINPKKYYNLEKIQDLSDKNKIIYYKAKLLMMYGIYPPLEIIKNDMHNGYLLKATGFIPKYTFICEYAGEVKKSSTIDKKKVQSDSFMELISTDSADTSLDIFPDRIGNIAMFMSGINNKTMKRYQNVKSLKCKIDGNPHILLFASKDIKESEVLYLNYNAGNGKNPQNTSYYVPIPK